MENTSAIVIPAGTDSRIPRPAAQDSTGVFAWWRAASPEARRAFMAASLGWMLDMFDVSLYALVLASLMADLGMTKAIGGLLGSVTLLASAAGGIIFGMVADRYGRTRALMASILMYSVFTGASGFTHTVTQLAVMRLFVGLGMGGEWGSGATLVSEIWPAVHRQKALAFMQSFAAFGLVAAPIVTAFVMPRFGWRAVFFVGVLPALLTFWIRRNVKESRMWEEQQATHPDSRGSFWDMFRGRLLPVTTAVTLMHAFTSFAWWGFNLWVPAFLSLPEAQGGIGLSAFAMAGLVAAMYVGQWFGYTTFGYASDRFGRKSSSVVYLVASAVFVLAYAATKNPLVLLFLGPPAAFFGSGHISGFGAVTAEIYPTRIRARAQGFTYNIGRVAAAAAPFTVGSLAQTHGFQLALSITAAAYVLSAVMWVAIPETKGKPLP